MNATRTAAFCVLLLLASASVPLAADAMSFDDSISWSLREQLEGAVRAKLGELTDSKNEHGVKDKRGTYSRKFRQQEDGSYLASVTVDTAGATTLTTERIELTLQDQGGRWQVTGHEVKDTYQGLHRPQGLTCYPFETFRFDREGLKLTADNGGVCEGYYQGEVYGFLVMAPKIDYDYRIPDQISLIRQGHDYYALYDFLEKDHSRYITFPPERFLFLCDAATCEDLLAESFTGLTRKSPAERKESDVVPAGLYEPLVRQVEKSTRETERDRRDSAFADFRRPDDPGHRYYVARVHKNDDHAIGITYNNRGGYEVTFWVNHRVVDPESPRGPVFGYYTEETLKSSTPYELERRDDDESRLYDVHSLKGVVEAGIGDPEMVSADIEFVLNIKENLRVLPFFIANVPRGDEESYQRATLFVNSVQLDSTELTWVRTGPFGGIIVLPDEVPAGTRLALRMDFDTRAIRKWNHAYSQLARFGWMPFVRFADFIDEFELTIKTPAQYKVLGIGHQVEEKRDGDVLVTRWVADNPVVFPSVIFGKYISDKPGFDASKIDGTVIPVEVHVDEVSMMQLDFDVQTGQDAQDFSESLRAGARGIRGKQLRSIAEQAANSINLYREISGVDYPYGALNLVNDPAPALYGQAPSSLIYLGSFVFRGEGTMAGDTVLGGGGTSTAKFLKSVVAHEVGHQWWGSRVANANNRNYWFVETLAEYFSALYLEAVFGPKEYEQQVDEWRRNVLNRRMKSSVQEASALWPGEDGGAAYQSAVYNKGPYAFHILRRTFGDEKFFPFLKEFSQELVEKREIVTRDIQVAAEKALGGVTPDGQRYNVDLEWFFDQWIRGVGIPEFAIFYEVRRTEDGSYIIEGTIKQRVVMGSKREANVIEGAYYRGVVDVAVDARKGKQYSSKVIVDGLETPFRFVVPEKPVVVELNRDGGMLARDTLVNRSW